MGTSSDGGREDRPWQSYHTVYTNAKAGSFSNSASSISSVIPLLDITSLDLFNIQVLDTNPRNVGLFLNFI